MDPEVVRHLLVSIVKFLRTQLENSDEPTSCLKEEGAESVEVALQCLETAYGITDTSFPNLNQGLYDIYSEFLKKNGFNVSEISEAEKQAADLLKNEGNALMREEKFTEALDCYTRAIAKDSKNAVFYCNRAAAHSKMNNHEEAILDCNRALAIDSNYSKAYGRMGLAYSTLNDAKRAMECYKKALEVEPNNETYQCNLQIAKEKLETQSQQQSAPGLDAAFSALGGSGAPFDLGGLMNLAGLSGGGTGAGNGAGQPDLQGFLGNPALMNLATQLMSNPSMQNMMASFLGRSGMMPPTAPQAPSQPEPPRPPPTASSSDPSSQGSTSSGAPAQGPEGLNALLNAGRHLAEQMQAQHPELVEQIRTAMHRNQSPQDENGDRGGSDPPRPPQT